MYELQKPVIEGESPSVVCRLTDSTFVPFDPANTDYQEYLKWLAEGNTPEPADEPTVQPKNTTALGGTAY